jgi:hydroxymethylbilane synthase
VKPVRIGSRGSMLAKWQAQHIAELLNALGAPTEIVYIKTSGDRFQQAGINQIGIKGVFIKEIEDALLDGRVDIAVHSMKDVPTETPHGLEFPAICKRENPHDCLVSHGGVRFVDLPSGARVGTSSLRRQAQLRGARPDLQFLDLRGNVDTRLKKLEDGEYDAIVLAKAGLDRLGWSARITEVLSADICVPAVGQGALGIEARKDDHEITGLILKLNHAHTRAEITAERALLHELQGGCQVPLGALARADGDAMTITACIASMDGTRSVTRMIAGPSGEAEALGYQLARQMIAGGAAEILQQARSSVAGETGN